MLVDLRAESQPCTILGMHAEEGCLSTSEAARTIPDQDTAVRGHRGRMLSAPLTSCGQPRQGQRRHKCPREERRKRARSALVKWVRCLHDRGGSRQRESAIPSNPSIDPRGAELRLSTRTCNKTRRTTRQGRFVWPARPRRLGTVPTSRGGKSTNRAWRSDT